MSSSENPQSKKAKKRQKKPSSYETLTQKDADKDEEAFKYTAMPEPTQSVDLETQREATSHRHTRAIIVGVNPRDPGYALMFSLQAPGALNEISSLGTSHLPRSSFISVSTVADGVQPTVPPEHALATLDALDSLPLDQGASGPSHFFALDNVRLALTTESGTAPFRLVNSRHAQPNRLPVDDGNRGSLQWMDILELTGQDFPTKYAYFVATTAALLVDSEPIKVDIARPILLEDSVVHLSTLHRERIRSVMRIGFVDEPGVDAGGLYREWFVLLNQEISSAMNGVLRCVNASEQTFYLNQNSLHDIGENHLLFFYATGRLVGRALLEGYALGFHLALPLLKLVLGIPVSFSDMADFDPTAYQSMLWIRENRGVDTAGLDFSITETRGDTVAVVDLIENGRNIDVTDENKDLYLERRFRYLLFESVSSQLNVFLKGVYEVTPQELLMLFDPEEFDYLLCGSDDIDVDDWVANTKCSTNLRGHKVLQWLWELVREMSKEYRRRLLHFATGSSRVPLAGFSVLTSYDGRLCPFNLQGVAEHGSQYIASHACFNRLELPLYES